MSKLTPLKTIYRSSSTAFRRSPAVELGLAIISANVPRSLLERINDPGERPCAAILRASTDEQLDVVIAGLGALCPAGAVDVVAIHGQLSDSTPIILRKGLAPGRAVIVVCTDVANVPIPFRMLAEETIALGPHDHAMVKRVLRRVMGRAVPSFPEDFVLHPNPALVCGCIVPEMPVEQVVMALDRLGKELRLAEHELLPPLDECIEYGAARTWGWV